eukprot:gene9667-13016_t
MSFSPIKRINQNIHFVDTLDSTNNASLHSNIDMTDEIMHKTDKILVTKSNHIEVEIDTILLQQPVDIDALKLISRNPGGFINCRIRTRVWPKLLNINRYNVVDYRSYIDPHRDDTQVKCDVDRSLWNYRHIETWKESYREKRRKVLSDIIMSVLCKNENLYYYQGFHDIVSVFLLVVDEDHLAFALVDAMCNKFITDYMRKDFELVSQWMKILFIIIKQVDKELHGFIMLSELQPFFATSWLITWFAHDIKDVDAISRIYDVLLCSPPSFIIYLSAAYILHLRDGILACECDFAELHNYLVNAPEQCGIPFEDILIVADKLADEYPISKLKFACDRQLVSIIDSNRVAIFLRSNDKKMNNIVDSDWTLLQSINKKSGVSPRNRTFPIISAYIDSFLIEQKNNKTSSIDSNEKNKEISKKNQSASSQWHLPSTVVTSSIMISLVAVIIVWKYSQIPFGALH